MPTSHYVKVNNLHLRYLDFGNRLAPTVVFYHATGFTSELWQPIIRDLQDEFHCVALDQRGHGGSDKHADEFSWPATVDDFQKFLEAVQWEPVIAVGHSSGATSVAVAAARRPGLVEKAVLIEPTIRQRDSAAPNPEGNPLIERTRNRRARWPNRAAMVEALGQRAPYKSWMPEMLHLFAEHATAQTEGGEVELLCTPAIEAAIYASFRAYDPWPYLPEVRQPLLVIHGTGASVLPTTNEAEIRPQWPQAQWVNIAEGGHLVLMEAPEKVSQAIQTFLRARS
ncbi:MAG: alpha/beta hydrolase [Chloroflexi bacterium]|nr:MAG: alpha/beta hydrolase [Chloroflexota bacterium]